MHLYKIYRRTAAGSVQVWWQEVSGARFRTHSGKLGGKVVTAEWTKCYATNVGRSNEFTAEEQALKEAVSHYKKKIKDGYSKTVKAAKASKRFKPMLAHEYADYAELVEETLGLATVYSQPKLDGIRCIADEEQLLTRRNTPITSCPHVEHALKRFFNKYPGVKLDGELYNHDLRDDFNTIVSLVRKDGNPTTFRMTAPVVRYYVYDIIDGSDDSYTRRMTRLKELLRLTEAHRAAIRPVETTIVKSMKHLEELSSGYLKKGYEGAILRLPGEYQQKRTKLLLKYKPMQEAEFEVVNILVGKGNRAGMAGRAVLRATEKQRKRVKGVGVTSETFKASLLGDVTFLKKLYKNKNKYIGGDATLQFARLTPKGVPRHPRVKTFYPGGRKL